MMKDKVTPMRMKGKEHRCKTGTEARNLTQ